MLNVNVYHPTPVIPGPTALINPIAHLFIPIAPIDPNNSPKKKNQTHNVVGTQGSNQNIAN